MTTRDPISAWKDVYDEAARQPDWLGAHRWGYSAEVGRRTVEDIRRKLAVEPEHRVLEIGCGSGAVLSRLLHQGQDGVGADLSFALLARRRDLAAEGCRLQLLNAEGGRLPLRDETFDRVLCYSVIQCYPTPEYARNAVRELIRVCRPSGKILLGDVFGTGERFWTALRTRPTSLEPLRTLLEFPAMAPVRTLLEPVRRGYRWLAGRETGAGGDGLPPRRHFTHGFFRRVARRAGCRVEVLRQDIEGRGTSNERFDVLIHKP